MAWGATIAVNVLTVLTLSLIFNLFPLYLMKEAGKSLCSNYWLFEYQYRSNLKVRRSERFGHGRTRGFLNFFKSDQGIKVSSDKTVTKC